MAKRAYLVKVEPNINNNKFYLMENEDGSSMFKVTYGRIGTQGTKHTYSMREWDKKYREKITKGYKDMTNIRTNEQDDTGFSPIADPIINEVCELLQKAANNFLSRNYTTATLESVTPVMIEKANLLIQNLTRLNEIHQTDIKIFNETLIELFKIINRRMNYVANYLAKDYSDYSKIITREKNLLDVMATSIVLNDYQNKNVKEKITILDALGINIENASQEEFEKVKSLLDDNVPVEPKHVFKVVNHKTEKRFNDYCEKYNIKDSDKKLLWHGSGNENWLSILEKGLLIRPSCARYTGSMFGDGLYFAPKASKSWGYTSYRGTYWRNGNETKAFMALYDTAYGKPYNAEHCDSYDLDFILSKGCNCLHAYKGTSGLRNEEIVFYDTAQVTVRYLVEF